MWGFVALFLLSCTFLWNLLQNYGKSKSNYWAERGFFALQGKTSLLELLSGRKTTGDSDVEHYKAMGGQPIGGIMEFGNPVLFVKDLDIARDIFIKDFDSFFDRREFGQTEPLFTENLFFMKGQAWKNMRAFLSPTFTSGRIRRMFPHFGRSAQNLKKFILRQPQETETYSIPVSESMRKYAIEVISGAAFGLDVNIFENQDQTFYEMAKKLGDMTLSRKIRFAIFSTFPKFANFFKISTMDPTVFRYFEAVLKTSLKAREENYKSGNKNDDFIQLLVEARRGALSLDNSQEKLYKEEEDAEMKSGNKNDIQWTDTVAVAQAFIFMAAGFDTVANNLEIAICLLALHPEIQEKVFQEVEQLTENQGQGQDQVTVTYENVNKMEYLDMFVAEVLRLYPAVSRLERQCMKPYKIPGTKLTIPKGTIVAFSAEGIHRDEKHFPNPMEFNPDRFMQEEKAKRHSYSYMPFGLGPRNCIGMRFALVETKAALANIVKNFEISVSNQMSNLLGNDLEKAFVRDVFGYRSRPGLKLQFKMRS